MDGNSIVKGSPRHLKSKQSYFKVPTLSINQSPKEAAQKENARFKDSLFVIQKYIERPLLIHGRKFDIRIWVLYYQKTVYIYQEGYIRTACERFSSTETSVNNTYIHLTNNAVQKNSQNYGQHEEGNQLGFKEFLKYMKDQDPRFDIAEMHEQIEEAIKISFLSIEHLFEVRRR